jgi:hypothetical protein
MLDVLGSHSVLEQLDFTVDPKPMVDTLYDQVAALPRITMARADIYTKECVDGTPDQQDWRTPGGYRYRCLTRGGQSRGADDH